MDYEKTLRWIISQPPGSVQWLSTQRDLVELVAWVGSRRLIRDFRGMPMSQRLLARLAFAAVGLPCPRRLSHIAWRIRNRLTPMPPLSERIKFI